MPRGTEHEPLNRLGLLTDPSVDAMPPTTLPELSSQQAAQFPDLEETLTKLNRPGVDEAARG